MKTLHTALREDVGRLARNLVRSELLSAGGVAEVTFESTPSGLTVKYDPAVIDDAKLLEIMRRYGVCRSLE